MAKKQPIIVLRSRHFVCHLRICNPICVKLLQLMYAVIMHDSLKTDVSVLINGSVTANYSVSRPPFCPPSWNLESDLCQTSATDVFYYYYYCVKLLQIMSGVIPCHLKKRRPHLKPFSWRPQTRHTHTWTHTHDDSIRRNAMYCA